MLPTKLQFIGTMWFQRRRFKCEKLANDERQVMAKAHMAFGNNFAVFSSISELILLTTILNLFLVSIL